MNRKFLILLLALLLTACQSRSKRLPKDVIDKRIPTIAVLEFSDKSHFRFNWNVGEGIRDSLAHRYTCAITAI